MDENHEETVKRKEIVVKIGAGIIGFLAFFFCLTVYSSMLQKNSDSEIREQAGFIQNMIGNFGGDGSATNQFFITLFLFYFSPIAAALIILKFILEYAEQRKLFHNAFLSTGLSVFIHLAMIPMYVFSAIYLLTIIMAFMILLIGYGILMARILFPNRKDALTLLESHPLGLPIKIAGAILPSREEQNQIDKMKEGMHKKDRKRFNRGIGSYLSIALTVSKIAMLLPIAMQIYYWLFFKAAMQG